MRFGELINRSFDIAWRYKSLWLFGLFAGMGGGSFNLDLGGNVEADLSGDGFPLAINEQFLAPLILAGITLGLLFFVCYLIASPALVDAVNKITRGGKYRFGDSFSRGIDFFGRFLGLSLLAVAAGISGVAAAVIPGFILAAISMLLLIPYILILIPIAISVWFFLFHTFYLAQVVIVTRDCSIGDALAEGWLLVRRNIGNCVMITLIFIGLGVALAIAVGIIGLFTFLPLNLMIASLTENLAVMVLLGVVLGLPVSLALGGFSGTFFNALYVQFYFRLVEPGGVALAPAPPSSEPGTA
jgi:hypothetical protein